MTPAPQQDAAPTRRSTTGRRPVRTRLVGAVLVGSALASGGPTPLVGAAGAAPGPGAATFRPPVAAPVQVLRDFSPPPAPWAAGHRGVDLAAPVGSAVVSPADGVVTFAGVVAGVGTVTVSHPGGLRTSLQPVAADVPVGGAVRAGDVVGTVQDSAATAQGMAGPTSHCAPASCVHWGMRRGTAYVDPLETLGRPGPVVLLPDD